MYHGTLLFDPELQKVTKVFQCPRCSFKAKQKQSLDKHLNGHNDCKLCGEVFLGSNGKRKLARHMKTHEVKPKKQQLCVFCNKEYKDRRILTRHFKVCKKKPRDVQPNVEISEDHMPIKSEKVEDMCLISTSHDDFTIKQELTEDNVQPNV